MSGFFDNLIPDHRGYLDKATEALLGARNDILREYGDSYNSPLNMNHPSVRMAMDWNPTSAGVTAFHSSLGALSGEALEQGSHLGSVRAAMERMLMKGPGLGPSEATWLAKNMDKWKELPEWLQKKLAGANITKADIPDSKVLPFSVTDDEANMSVLLLDKLVKTGILSKADEKAFFKGNPNDKTMMKKILSKLDEMGYDAVPYVNATEDAGSLSYVLTKPKSFFENQMQRGK